MTIAEETIMQHLNSLLSQSEPGAILHHMHVVSAPPDAIGPLGLPAQDQLHTDIYALAPEGQVDVDEFVSKVMFKAHADATKEGHRILFVALAQEMWFVHSQALDEHAKELLEQGRLQEHPAAQEVTVLYAACRDGRRWYGRHVLTGPQAGEKLNVELLVGRPSPREALGIAGARLVRGLVGLQ
ncbi:MAG: hypothetical protein ABWY93_18725 [Mycobacterium sp.]